MPAFDGLNLDTTRFNVAVTRLAATSKKAAVEVMKDQARLLFVQVAKITPPYHGSVTGRAAEVNARAKVAADIRSLYGTRSDAYDLIKDRAGETRADAYWAQLSKNNLPLATSILKDATGKSLGVFDEGTLHKRTSGGSRRRSRRANAKTVSAREFIYFVSNDEALASYVEKEQGHVWWLASGWAPALLALGAKAPYGVGKLPAPGNLRVEVTATDIIIRMENKVSFGRGVKDIERRIQWALETRVGALDRRWASYLNRAAKDAGFTKTLSAK